MRREDVHLLVVEDNPSYLEELLGWLKEEFGYQKINIAVNAQDAEEKLRNPCDIIIADMRMEYDDSGFAVLDFVRANNLSTVVIILTANDNVSDCRRAFREGAWDYISKSMKGNTFESLDTSIQDAIAYLNRWGNRSDQQWLTENLTTLENKYFGQWIAILNQSVIEAADTEDELIRLLEERKLRLFTIVKKQVGDLRPIEKLVAEEENDHLEFKSTLQWDIKLNRENKELRFSVLKTIVAFLNSDGGILLIGIKDDGNLFGIEKDIQCLSDGNLDKFQRHLFQLIENHIGNLFSSYIKIRFANINQRNICAIYVQKSSSKAFLKSQKGLEFYIRVGNSSRLIGIPEIYSHL